MFKTKFKIDFFKNKSSNETSSDTFTNSFETSINSFINSIEDNIKSLNIYHSPENKDSHFMRVFPKLKEIEESGYVLKNFYENFPDFIETNKQDKSFIQMETDLKPLIDFILGLVKNATKYEDSEQNSIDNLLCETLINTKNYIDGLNDFEMTKGTIRRKVEIYTGNKDSKIFFRSLVEWHLPTIRQQNQLISKTEKNAENNFFIETGINLEIMYLKDLLFTATTSKYSAQQIIDEFYTIAIQKALQELSNGYYRNFLQQITSIIRIISADAKIDVNSETKTHDRLVNLLLANGITTRNLVQLQSIRSHLPPQFRENETEFSNSSLQIIIKAAEKALDGQPNCIETINSGDLLELPNLSPEQCAELMPTPRHTVNLMIDELLGHGGGNYAFTVCWGNTVKYALRKPLSVYIDAQANRKRKKREFIGPGILPVFNVASPNFAGNYMRLEHMQLANLGSLKKLPKIYRAPEYMALFLEEIIKAVDDLHSRGYGLLDIKPDNVLVIENNENEVHAKLTDLDEATKFKELRVAARQKSDKQESNEKEKFCYGSPGYIAPERDKGEIPTVKESKAADYWAIGVSAYQLAMQTNPEEELVLLPIKEDKTFIGFKDPYFREENRGFFQQNQRGEFINVFAKELAEVIEKLLASNVNERIKNFKKGKTLKILEMSFFKLVKNLEASKQNISNNIDGIIKTPIIKTPIPEWNDALEKKLNEMGFSDCEKLKKCINQFHQQKNDEETQEKKLRKMQQVFDKAQYKGSSINDLLALIALRHPIDNRLNEIRLCKNLPVMQLGYPEPASSAGPRKLIALRKHCANFFPPASNNVPEEKASLLNRQDENDNLVPLTQWMV
jgi:serine/threonine protein kinase